MNNGRVGRARYPRGLGGRMIIADELDALVSGPATFKVGPITPGFRVRSMEQSWRYP